MRVAVVGAGIVGASAARFLAERGHAVTVYEQFPLGHARGSSHGRTRIVRRAYPDAFFTACMAEAYPMWAELEAESGRRLVDACGLMYAGKEDAPRVTAMADALGELDVPHEMLAPRESAQRLPGLLLPAGFVGIFTPEAGWVDAAAALAATQALARDRGAEFRTETATHAPLARDFDAFVVAAGAWVRNFVAVDVRVTQQTFAYVGPPRPGPVWIDDATLTYGIPGDPKGHKIGAHMPGPEIDPDRDARTPVAAHLDQIEEVARERFGIVKPRLEDVTTCLYTSTPDEDFRVGRLGDRGFWASACSGHGFKLGPWVGRMLANFVDGKDAPESHPRFLVTNESPKT